MLWWDLSTYYIVMAFDQASTTFALKGGGDIFKSLLPNNRSYEECILVRRKTASNLGGRHCCVERPWKKTYMF